MHTQPQIAIWHARGVLNKMGHMAGVRGSVLLVRGALRRMATRTEKDALGEVEVAAARLWGAQTQRSLRNFDIGRAGAPEDCSFREQMPLEIVHALATIKRAAATVNAQH